MNIMMDWLHIIQYWLVLINRIFAVEGSALLTKGCIMVRSLLYKACVGVSKENMGDINILIVERRVLYR